jgi:hypothetical protein
VVFTLPFPVSRFPFPVSRFFLMSSRKKNPSRMPGLGVVTTSFHTRELGALRGFAFAGIPRTF